MSERRRVGAALATMLAVLLISLPGAWAEDGESEETARQDAAGPTPKLYLVPGGALGDGVSQIVTERTNEAVRRQLGGDRNLDLLPGFLELLGSSGGDEYSIVAEAERQYTSAIGLLRAEEYERAAETFQRALDMIEANLGGLNNFNIITDALSNLAVAYFHSGFDLDARQNMQRFAQLRPNAQLDPEIFPGELREIFENEAERVRSAETGVLTIETSRPGAMVYIDGDLKGSTPVVVEDVGFGHHYLLVRQGSVVHSEVIRVRARGQEQTITVDMEAAAQSEGPGDLPAYYVDLQERFQTGRFGSDLSPYLVELTNQTGADYVGWVILKRERAEYVATPFVYRARDGMMVQAEEVSFNLELSNLRSRVTRLGAIISMSVTSMPLDRAVEEVDLLPAAPPEPVVEAASPEEPSASEPAEEEPASAVAEAPRERLPVPSASTGASRDEIASPGYEESEERSKMMRNLGYGGAAALAGGIVAGTIIFLVRGSATPAGFEAEVEW